MQLFFKSCIRKKSFVHLKKSCIILTAIMFDCSVIMLRTNVISRSQDDHYVAFPLNYIKHCYETMTWLRTSSLSSNGGRLFCLDETVVDNFIQTVGSTSLLLLFLWRFCCTAARLKTLFSCFSSRMKRTAFLLVFGVVLSFCEAQVSTSPVHMSWCFEHGLIFRWVLSSSADLTCSLRTNVSVCLLQNTRNIIFCFPGFMSVLICSRRTQEARRVERRNMWSSSPPLRPRWAPLPRTSATTCSALWRAATLPPTSSWPPSACRRRWRSSPWVTNTQQTTSSTVKITQEVSSGKTSVW